VAIRDFRSGNSYEGEYIYRRRHRAVNLAMEVRERVLARLVATERDQAAGGSGGGPGPSAVILGEGLAVEDVGRGAGGER